MQGSADADLLLGNRRLRGLEIGLPWELPGLTLVFRGLIVISTSPKVEIILSSSSFLRLLFRISLKLRPFPCTVLLGMAWVVVHLVGVCPPVQRLPSAFGYFRGVRV